MRQAFRQPGFTRLYAGLTASMFGDSAMLLVLSIWVKTLTGSNAQAGLTFFFMVIPALLRAAARHLDRPRQAQAVAGLGPRRLGHRRPPPGAGARARARSGSSGSVAVLYGVSFVVLPAALNGLLKELMPEEMLVDANSSLQTTKESFRLFGPLIGALLFTWLGGWAVARARRGVVLRGRRA